MWNCHTFIGTAEDKPFVEAAIAQLDEEVFDCWTCKPTFQVKINEDELELHVQYENPISSDFECAHGHEALDLAMAFIQGFLCAKKWFGK